MSTNEHPSAASDQQETSLTPNQIREREEAEQARKQLEDQAGMPLEEIVRTTNVTLAQRGFTRRESARAHIPLPLSTKKRLIIQSESKEAKADQKEEEEGE